MNKQTPEEFLAKLLSNTTATTPNEFAVRAKNLLTIHGDYDSALADAMGRWLESQNVRNGQVMSTLCHMISVEIALSARESSAVCALVDTYSDYIHQAAHIYFANIPKDKKSPRRRK